MKTRVIILSLLALLLATALLVYHQQKKSGQGELFYCGTIEATQVRLAFQVGGRVVSVPVREGQAVARDQLLAALDEAEFISRRNQAEANYVRAQKSLEQAQAMLHLLEMTLPAEVARAEAGLMVMQAQLDEIRAGSRAQDTARAKQMMEAAASVYEDAKRNLARFEALLEKGAVAERERDAVRVRYDTALKEYERSQAAYDLIREGSRAETVRAAEARLKEAEALLRQSRSNLLRIEAARREVEVARSQVAAAAAAREQAGIQLSYTRVKAPQAGIITSRSVEPGEVVTPGREIMTLANLEQVVLTIFVDAARVGRVKPGQPAEIRVDSFPGRIFKGEVTFISPEAEFTPKIIQTQKERVKLVYQVKIAIPNASLELKSGMPADVWLR